MARFFDADAAWERMKEIRREQGLPERIEDPVALAQIARLMHAPNPNKVKNGRKSAA